ncbi:MAG: bifunctional oligoribonuclease/PAP phosphatase NrnA [Firmicutes bacterium]|nr:bifunctional oligoribonuclease/PAP phosphatase NrnA [Bacillota bacterium]
MIWAEQAARILLGARSLLIMSHIFPDGDSIGSLLALGLALARRSREVTLVCPDDIPETYAFLPGIEGILTVEGARERLSAGRNVDLVVILDSSDLERIGKGANLIPEDACVVNIDHHVTNKNFGAHNFIKVEAAAVGELVYALLLALGTDIDKDIATCLLTALIADTGSFRYSNTTAETFDIAARLVKRGAEPAVIAEHVFETKPFSSLKLLGRVLDNLELSPDGRVAWVSLPHRLLDEFHVNEAQTEGFVNYARMVAGVEVAVLFREEANSRIRVGLRSRDRFDVSRLAQRFGGGGHAKAAGCTIEGDLEHAKQLVLEAIADELGNEPRNNGNETGGIHAEEAEGRVRGR